MKKNIVITGRGLITPLGNGLERNEEALRNGESGVSYIQEWKDKGLESCIAGIIDENTIECSVINKKNKRFMSRNSIFAVAAAYEAINEAGLSEEDLKKYRIAVIIGHGGSTQGIAYKETATLEKTLKIKRVSPFIVPKAMASSACSNVSLIFGITGENYTISSACASGSHAVTVAARLIDADIYDIVITGGTEETSWVQTSGFDAMRAVTRAANDNPTAGSRPFDKDRSGFVIAEGAGIIVLESAEHAKARNAKAIAKFSGSAANSNATDMVVPNADSSAKVMSESLENAKLKPEDISYINTHGTATPIGDPIEIDSIKQVFYETNPNIAINSTKSMTGHMIGATGAIELIFCTQMINKGFICPTINLDNPEDEFEWANLVKETVDTEVKHALSNSFGFGGTNSSIIVSAID